MNEQKNKLDQHMNSKKAEAIIDGKQNELRNDGYSNMLNKYGTKQDNSTAYHYNAESYVNDMELEALYEGNGLFKKIIDRPSEEAVKHGLDIDFGDESISEYVEERLDDLCFESKFASAEKWARLYGGSIIVMIVDDGKGLEEPLCFSQVHAIKELRVFERAIVQPDYNSMYRQKFTNSGEITFGEPEFYYISSIYGYFRVHRSRCLVFKNGELPENSTNELYRYWGVPEYVKVKRALRECITTHENGTKLLERSVQAIYKMKNLANMLSTTDGEDKVLQRLQVIDMARGILNSIAIDTDGEDYDFKTITMSGVKDIIDSTCNMLSAVTDIPQTILFGRSPSGMNSTGESDTENYYNMVENIQKQNMKSNTRLLLNLILKQAVYEGIIDKAPKYKVKFAALWSLTETEKADVESKKANTEHIKAQTAEIYLMNNIIDPSEVRKTLANDGIYDIDEPDDNGEEMSEEEVYNNEIINISDTSEDEDDSIIHLGDDVISIVDDNKDEKSSDEHIHILSENEMNGTDIPAAAVIIINNGKILCAIRKDNGLICGPGGHVEDGETTEETAIRETIEEFHIKPLKLIPLGVNKPSNSSYLSSMIYFTDEYEGLPIADGKEMLYADWLTLDELKNKSLYPPFEDSLKMLVDFLKTYLTSNVSADTITISDNFDGGPGSGNWGHSGRPGKLGGSGKGGGKQNRTGTKETGFSSKAKASGESKGSNILSKAPKCIDDVIHYEVSKDVSKKVKSLSNKYKRNVDKMDTYIYRDKMDNDIETLFDKSTMTTKEFTDKSIQVTEKWSDEDKLLDSVYTGNDIDTIVKKGLFKEKHALSDEYMLTADEEKKYEHYAGKLNEKLYQGKELSKADIAVVEHFNRCAEPLGRDIDLYRMVGKNYLDSILEQTKVVNHEELLGKEITNKALLSTSPGINSFFWRKDVCIKIKTPKDISVCVTRSTGDGEIVIPVNSRMKVTKIEEVKNLVLPMWDSEKSNDGIVLPSGMRSNDSIGRTHTGYYMEMELIGYEN